MEATKTKRVGGLPPRYGFMLNPYPDQRVWRCPLCERKIGQHKVPLLIHVDPLHLIALNYTCRFCRTCDLLSHCATINYRIQEDGRGWIS